MAGSGLITWRITLDVRRASSQPRPPAGLPRALLVPPVRQTNQALLVALMLAFGTGVITIATGSPSGAWVAIGHGLCGLAVVLLIPWKSRVARRGLRRARPTRWLSLLLALLALAVLFFGLAYATGLVRSVASWRRDGEKYHHNWRIDADF